ncbi:MAG: HNH endonuclease [Phycisphaeraceae bacterium]|nr:HNH endonuclease [Phycisphaerales bacterium]MCB9843723.1 HNH endonuclease [Phycisphaeraceae bacterium]
MDARPANDGQRWNREELILAFELYCRIPFQRTKATDARVKELAGLLHRTPASIARKLGNFGAFDPQLAARNISGLTHGSKLDKAIWDEFHADWNGLIIRAHDLRLEREPHRLEVGSLVAPSGPSEMIVTGKQRLHQAFFRDAVVSSYNNRCCVTGLSIVECLVAGHIVPWSVDVHRRADPTNGLCMSATFDRLFDCGLVTIGDDLTLVVSDRVRRLNNQAATDLVVARHGQKIIPPARFYPDPACLRWHRENRFQVA